MKLTITPKAQEWFKREIELGDGQGIKFYGKVYGKTQVHDGFEEADEWFFKGYDLVVDYDTVLDEPKYDFIQV
jgi:uncharacterized protein YneR